MDAPKMKVKCSVDNCRYNKEHLCFAHGLEVSAMGSNKADTSDGTCCETFIGK